MNGGQAPRVIDTAKTFEAPLGLYRLDDTPLGQTLRAFDVEYDLSDEDAAKIPTTGPVLIVANHPFGGVDAAILGDILTAVRPDFRLLGNAAMADTPGIGDWVIPLDERGGPAALETSLRWFETGGALGVFPSGAVSQLRLREAQISDPPSPALAGGPPRRSGATLVPLFFEGRNRMFFQLAGLIHP